MASMETARSSTALQPQEIQLLAAIVATMVPILNRMPPAPQTQAANFAAPVEQQAAIALVQDITAASLRKLAAYLDQHAEQHRALEPCIPMVTHAAQCFASRDFAACFGAVWQAYQAIAQACAADPAVPALPEAQAGFVQTH